MRRTGAATVLVGTVLAGILWGWSWSGGDRDELAGWVEAGATAAAFLAAAVAAVFAAGAFRLESRREQRWEEQQRSAQATLVAAWFEMRADPWSHDGDRDGSMLWLLPSSGTNYYPSVAYRNASDVPVTRVRLELSVAAVDPETGAESGQSFGVMTRELIPPSSERGYWDLDEWMVDKREQLIGEATNAGYDQTVTRVVLQFSDAAGRRWLRDEIGQLLMTFERREPRKYRWWRANDRRRRRRQAEQWTESGLAPAAHPAPEGAGGLAGVEDGGGLAAHHGADGASVDDELDRPGQA